MKLDGNADVCVIGRTNFATGIGSIAYAACELFSRYFSVSLLPVHSGTVQSETVTLPSGRRIPVASSANGAGAVFYADVLWNGASDKNYELVPEGALRIAHIAYDSDQLPPEWVEILNSRFDAVYFTSRHLMDVALHSGVRIPIGWLPIGLDLAPLLCALPVPADHDLVTFGSVASFHPRKGTDTLVQAFVDEFGAESAARLVLHSNLWFGEFPDYIENMVRSSGAGNIVLSRSGLTREQLVALEKSFDIFVNCAMGEGYSIGPREALALGKPLVLSDLGPHEDMAGLDGVFSIPATARRPARYPEIDGRVFGSQFAVSVADTRACLREAFEYIRAGKNTSDAVRQRRRRAAEFSLDRLATSYASVVSPDVAKYRADEKHSPFVVIPKLATTTARDRTGAFGQHLSAVDRVVVPAHDGPILNVLNRFMDNLADAPQRHHGAMVLPDWNAERVFGDERAGLRYFRYYSADTPNLWCSIFEPLYGLTEGRLDGERFLYQRSMIAERRDRSDCLDLAEAATGRLFNGPGYSRLRRLYHGQWQRYVRLAAPRQDEIESQWSRVPKGRVVGISLGPSLVQEPGGSVRLGGDELLDEVARWLSDRFPDTEVERFTVLLDAGAAQLAEGARARFRAAVQLETYAPITGGNEDRQSAGGDEDGGWPVLAREPAHSPERAWAEIRDAILMSRCHVVFCPPGDVASALSYMNPDVALVCIDGA